MTQGGGPIGSISFAVNESHPSKVHDFLASIAPSSFIGLKSIFEGKPMFTHFASDAKHWTSTKIKFAQTLMPHEKLCNHFFRQNHVSPAQRCYSSLGNRHSWFEGHPNPVGIVSAHVVSCAQSNRVSAVQTYYSSVRRKYSFQVTIGWLHGFRDRRVEEALSHTLLITSKRAMQRLGGNKLGTNFI